MMDQVILVDEQDRALGFMEKMEAHRKGILHRAFSVLLFNSNGEVLLQKRSATKYHSAGLWTNTCCSHPKPDEKIEVAVSRRLREEMGIELLPEFAYKFLYKVHLDNDLIEHELDHVFIGVYNGEPVINSHEVEDWKFVPLESVRKQIALNPELYTYWFRLIVEHPQLASVVV
jgi:isopentenyl-diphosphate Delta-isomerase